MGVGIHSDVAILELPASLKVIIIEIYQVNGQSFFKGVKIPDHEKQERQNCPNLAPQAKDHDQRTR